MSATTYPSLTEWSVADTCRAADEGWGIFDCDGSGNGRTQLQASDEAEMFPDDDAAWRFVVSQSYTSEFHARALSVIERHNKAEFLAVYALCHGERRP